MIIALTYIKYLLNIDTKITYFLLFIVCFIGDSTNLYPEISPPVSKDIEDEANSYFQRIYNHPPHPTLSIEEVLEMLKKFKDSQNPRERVSGAALPF